MNEETKRAILDLVYPIGIVIGWHVQCDFDPEKVFGGTWIYLGEIAGEADDIVFIKRVS